jgi:hypothetical protein
MSHKAAGRWRLSISQQRQLKELSLFSISASPCELNSTDFGCDYIRKLNANFLTSFSKTCIKVAQLRFPFPSMKATTSSSIRIEMWLVLLASAALTTPKVLCQYEVRSQMQREIQELIRGGLDESVDRIRTIRRGTELVTVDSLVVGRKLLGGACAAAEERLIERAVMLMERGFRHLELVESDNQRISKDKAIALALRAYAYDTILHDHSSAILLAKAALALDPENYMAKAIVEAVSTAQTADRIFGTSIGRINSGYASSGQPAIDFVKSQSGPNRLRATVAAIGTFRIEASTNLLDWSPVWEGEIPSGQFQIPQIASDSPQRFFRIFTVSPQPK